MRSFLPFRTRRRLCALALLVAGTVARPGNAAAQSDAQRDSVVQLAEALRTLRTPPTEGGVPVYSPEALRRWRAGLDSLRARHAAFNTAGWSVADRIDHILVRTQLDAFDFERRVLRPWARDPGHWVDLLARTPYTGVPLTAEGRTRLTQQLRAVPRTVAAARRELTEPAGELAGIAHFHLTRSDGVNQGEPRRQPRPIRRAFSDGTRAEGWAFYIEEMYLHTGLLDDRPKGRELFWIAQLKRAARVHAELRMQTGEWTLDDAIKYLVREVPLMEENLARYDLAIYLRRPAYGMNYTIGKTQLEQLLADRQRQLGNTFDLGAFHDAFLAAGPIPIALIRWELTGLDDELCALGVLK